MLNIATEAEHNIDHWRNRVDLAAAFRWTAKLNMHEAIANHYSFAVNSDGTQFLMNPKRHFARIRASDLILLNANDPDATSNKDKLDPTAWGLHSSVHRLCPHARCIMHVHSVFATVLASLKDSALQPIDQNTAMFYERTIVDEGFGGLAFESEGKRCAKLLNDPKVKVMIMGNHGIMVIGATIAETFGRLYYFERAAETYIRALQTGQPLRILPHRIAAKTAQEIEDYPSSDQIHFEELKALLDQEGSDYAT